MTPTDTKAPKADKPAAAAAPKKEQHVIPIEEVNNTISALWDSTGIWKRMVNTLQDPNIKGVMIKACNMQEMPLSGLDIIPTQQGPKPYVNSEGAKFSRERHLAKSGRKMVGREINLIPYDKMPGSIKDRDQQQGRMYFEIVSTVENVDQKQQIIDAVCNGTIPADKVAALLEQLAIITKYKTHSSFSNQSEKFADNRQPDVILKKGTTQCHRRADLEMSMQYVLPDDDAPLDAEFIVKGEAPQAPDKAKAAADAAAAGPAMPQRTLMPEKVTEQPTADHKKPMETPPPPDASVLTAVKAIMVEVNKVFDEAKVPKADRMKFFNQNALPISMTQMTVELANKALELVRKTYKKTSEALPAETPAKTEEQKDPARHQALQKVFGLREKAGFKSEDELRAWVKAKSGKGLSEMGAAEIDVIADGIKVFANFLGNYQKWGFGSQPELVVYLEDAAQKKFHDLTPQEIEERAKELDGFLDTK